MARGCSGNESSVRFRGCSTGSRGLSELTTRHAVPSSFRDPAGFVFWEDGALYRQVNLVYRDNYDCLMNSGLYEKLTGAGLLVQHEEVEIPTPTPDLSYHVIRPQLIPFTSYPYEWSFSQLRDAAATMLQIEKICLDFGMSLKDSSAYNIQFVRGKPVFVDTLSFERYHEGQPWVAYRQFCQHFLAPLALMSYRDIRLSQLLRVHIDGVPLDLASCLLPLRTRLNFGMLAHLHMHAQSQRHYAGRPGHRSSGRLSRLSLQGIVDSLEAAVSRTKWSAHGTEWVDYYDRTNYSPEAFEDKRRIVGMFLARVKPTSAWDLGANTGAFSQIAANQGIFTVSMDIDPAAVEVNYLKCREAKEGNILPLVMDLTNPSADIGWANEERMSLTERGPTDTVIALALIHHMAISNNVPFEKIAGFLGRICRNLIIEYVPKTDSQVQRLLATREDIFGGYTRAAFEREFERFFSVLDIAGLGNSERVIYLMTKK